MKRARAARARGAAGALSSAPPAGSRRLRLRRLLGLPLCALVACRPHVAPPRAGPIVLITLDSLRADVVGGLGGDPGLTPNLSSLGRQASWFGRAVASSSWAAPAMASLFTGLRCWQHQVITDASSRLPADLLTLPKALKALGYQTAGFTSGPWYDGAHGYAEGFDSFVDLGKGWDATEQLASLTGGRQFLWVHIPEPRAPYVRRAWLLPRLYPEAGAAAPRLPHEVDSADLAAYFDPSERLPAGERRLFWDMYRLDVAWADERVGRLLESLRASGQWDRTLLVIVANHGEEFGEHGQIEHGGNLGRELLEVPLLIKLPTAAPFRIAVPPGGRVAASRIWATLVAAAGGRPVPAAAPSLFQPSSAPILSELYLVNGGNEFSLLSGDEQLLWTSRFAPADPRYYRVREEAVQGAPEADLQAPSRLLPRAFLAAFESSPPLHGREGLGPPVLALERWEPRGGSRPVDDPPRREELARELAAAWSSFVTEERAPAEEARQRPSLPGRAP